MLVYCYYVSLLCSAYRRLIVKHRLCDRLRALKHAARSLSSTDVDSLFPRLCSWLQHVMAALAQRFAKTRTSTPHCLHSEAMG
jgi:hypothetical protein